MRRFQWSAASLWVVLATGAVVAQGQPTTPLPPLQGPYTRPSVSPYPRPSISPYLNLSRGGTPALNYYNLVRPQQDFQSSLNVLDTRTDLLGHTLAEGPVPLITGHPSQYMTHGRYFFNLGPRSATARPAVVPPAVTGALRPGN